MSFYTCGTLRCRCQNFIRSFWRKNTKQPFVLHWLRSETDRSLSLARPMSSSLEGNHNSRSTKQIRQNKQNGHQNKNEVHPVVFLHVKRFQTLYPPHLSFLQVNCVLKAVCCFGFKVTQAEAGFMKNRGFTASRWNQFSEFISPCKRTKSSFMTFCSDQNQCYATYTEAGTTPPRTSANFLYAQNISTHRRGVCNRRHAEPSPNERSQHETPQNTTACQETRRSFHMSTAHRLSELCMWSSSPKTIYHYAFNNDDANDYR